MVGQTAKWHVRQAAGSFLTRLLVLLAVATLLPLGVSLAQLQRDRAQAEARAADSALRGARLAAAQVGDRLDEARGIAHILEGTPAFWTTDDDGRDQTLGLFARAYPYMDSLGFVTPDLQQHGTSAYAAAVPRADLSGRSYARDAVASGQLTLTAEPLRSLVTQHTVLPIGVPLHRPGEDGLAGLLVAVLNVDRLPNVWSDVPLPAGATTMLLDTREGRVLTGNGDAGTLVGETISRENLQRILDGEQVGWVVTYARGAQSRLRALAKVEGTTWVVAVDIPASVIEREADAMARREMATAVLAGVIALGALAVLWRRLAKWLGGLQRAAAEWESGNWSYRIGSYGASEFGQLAARFDGMAAERAAAESAMRQQSAELDLARRRHAEHLAAIIQAQARLARAALDPDRLMRLAAEQVQALTGADAAVVELVDGQDGQDLVYAAASGTAADHVGLRLGLATSFTGLCVRTGRVLICDDATTDPRVDAEACRRVGIRSMVVAPLAQAGRTVGAVKITSSQPAAFSQPHADTLQLMVGSLGAGLDHAQAFATRTRAEQAARAQSERLAAVLRAATECAIIGTDLDGTITLFNDGAERMLGYARDELVGVRTLASLHDPDEVNARAAELGCTPGPEVLVAAARRGEAETREWTWCRRDDSRLLASVSVTGLHGENGELVGFIGIGTDVTQRRALDRMKDEFVSTVSHELRTPLTSIRGSLGLLAAGALAASPERSQRMLEIALNNADRLIRLINDILDLQRMATGRVSMQKSACDLTRVAAQSIEVMQAMALQAGVDLELDAAPTPVQVWADPDRLTQVVTNLLSNAIKFSPAGRSVRLTVHTSGQDAIIRVEDHGRGIPADKLATIFERFQQVDASDSRDKGGTGLGLAICRAIVEQHAGRIDVESELGHGSTFSVALPMLATAATPRPETLAGPGPSILVCDDDASVLEVVGAILHQHGYTVRFARSGAEAIQQLETSPPAALVLDLLMPGLPGAEVVAAIKARPATRDIPVLVLSVLRPGEGELDPASVAAWIAKPVQGNALVAALERLVGQPAGLAQ